VEHTLGNSVSSLPCWSTADIVKLYFYAVMMDGSPVWHGLGDWALFHADGELLPKAFTMVQGIGRSANWTVSSLFAVASFRE
jgi:hypothetical protein